MCWFIWFSYKDEKLIKRLSLTQKSRAVDYEYFHIENLLSFYHAHLSISDLNKDTSQPLLYKKYVIWFVWEIYNKEYLLNIIGIFDDESNFTELQVIGFLYDVLWEKFINYINWEFAIFIYDKINNNYLLYRDRWWTNNIYYRIHNWELFFASEIKSLVLNEPELNNSAFYEYMIFQFSISPNTIIKNIKTLRPWSYLKYNNKKITINEFCKYDFQENNNSILLAIENSVKRRIPMYQKKIFLSLSWWPDSNIILYFLNKHFKWKIIAYSFVRNENKEEIEYAKQNTKTLGIKHLCINMDNYKFPNLENDIYIHEWLVLLPNLCQIILEKYPEYSDIKVEFWWDWKEELFLWNDHYPYKEIFARYKYFKSKWLVKNYKINQEFLNKEMFDFNLQMIDKITLRNWIERRLPFTDYEMLRYSKIKNYKSIINKFLNEKWLYIVPVNFWYNDWIGFKNLYDNDLLKKKKILFKKINIKNVIY